MSDHCSDCGCAIDADGNPVATILPAEHFGSAQVVDGHVDIGGILVPHRYPTAEIFVRRLSTDLRVAEIAIAEHDGLACEELDHQNFEADRHPGGPEGYWRAKLGDAEYDEVFG